MLAMRVVFAASLLVAVPAAADTFGGFSGVDRPYLVNQDKVCRPLEVKAAVATGMPACEKAAADVVAKLSIKGPLVQRGDAAAFAATAASRTLTVTRVIDGKPSETVVTWTATDPIGKIVDVYASQYQDRVAVAYAARRLGKEVVDVVAFDLGKPSQARPVDPVTPVAPVAPVTTTPEDPAVVKAVAAARKASKAKALAAWSAVLAIDAQHSESLYRVAIAQLAAKQRPDAIKAIETLAKSTKPDAIEWLVEARFDNSFAALRSDAAFRAAVGFDRKGKTAYERLMGMGGQWEQNGTACDKPEVRLVATRDRVIKIRVKSRCEGSTYDLPFKGTWRLDGDRVVLTFATKGKQVTDEDEAGCRFQAAGDEDSLHCSLGHDIDFVVLPTRR